MNSQVVCVLIFSKLFFQPNSKGITFIATSSIETKYANENIQLKKPPGLNTMHCLQNITDLNVLSLHNISVSKTGDTIHEGESLFRK